MISLLAIILFVTVDLNAQDYIFPSRWQEDSINIDGINEEWEKPFEYYNYKAGLAFSISNDNKNLYLSFETKEPIFIVKMLRAGWSLKLQSKEKRKKINAAITFYPILIELEPKHDYIKKEEETVTFENWLDDYNLKACEYGIGGFKMLKHNSSYSMNRKEENTIDVALNYNKEKAAYELKIPFRNVFPKDLTLDERLKLRVTINAVSLPPDDSKLSVEGSSSTSKIYRQNEVIINRTNNTEEDTTTNINKIEEHLYEKAFFYHDFQLTKGS